MEYEMEDEPRKSADEDGDESWVTRDHRALRNQSSVKPSQYPGAKERKALVIPEEDEDN